MKFLSKIEAISRPRVFYRGTDPSRTERIRTGEADWDSYLFAADSIEKAKLYGPKIVTIVAKPSAKILYEGTMEFIKLAGKGKSGQSLLSFCSEAARKAKKTGYDAVWFTRQGDVGTAILNPSAFEMKE